MSTPHTGPLSRQYLQLKGKPTIPKKYRVQNLQDLQRLLKEALMVEHMTIPTYLCALYSIKDGYNVEAAQIIRSVVMEEMLHMILAANVLNAIGGKPGITDPDRRYIPTYPNPLPYSSAAFIVNLQKFSRESIETFLKIEKPAKPHARPQGDEFRTLSQFYEAIELALLELSGIDVDHINDMEDIRDLHWLERKATQNIFTGDPSWQVTPELYYGGGGDAIPVSNLHSALKALSEITGQGEGVHHSIWDGDEQLGQVDELAHYFRFNEIYQEQRYTHQDSVNSGPTGERMIVDWDQVYPMQKNPKMKPPRRGRNYGRDKLVQDKMYEFNRTYSALLRELDHALGGEPQRLMQAVVRMYDLKYQAVDLMRIPVGDQEFTAGPSFEYVE